MCRFWVEQVFRPANSTAVFGALAPEVESNSLRSRLELRLRRHYAQLFFSAALFFSLQNSHCPFQLHRLASAQPILKCEETPVKRTIFLSLSLLLLLVLKPTLQVSAGRGLPVRISQGGEVDNEVVNVSKSAGDEVVWSSDGDGFTISFQTSPFAASTFHVPAGGSASSGPVRPGAAWSLPVLHQ